MGFLPDLETIKALSVYFMRRTGIVDFTSLTITQSGNVAYTVDDCWYLTRDRLVHLHAKLNITGTGTTNNAVVIAGIPSAIFPAEHGGGSNDGYRIGEFLIKDTMTSYYEGSLIAYDQNDWRMIESDLGNYVGITPNFAFANGDILIIDAKYRR